MILSPDAPRIGIECLAFTKLFVHAHPCPFPRPPPVVDRRECHPRASGRGTCRRITIGVHGRAEAIRRRGRDRTRGAFAAGRVHVFPFLREVNPRSIAYVLVRFLNRSGFTFGVLTHFCFRFFGGEEEESQ